MLTELKLPFIEQSVVEHAGTRYALIETAAVGEKKLVVQGDTNGFMGKPLDAADVLLCPLTPENAAALRQRLSWLNPVTLGLRTSAGFGDRLGCATPGHVAAIRGTGVAPIFAQQSVRENTRTGRTPQQVVDDAMWGVLQSGWREAWGADADHLKTVADIAPFVRAGYSFYTIDPGDYVDDAAETDDPETLQAKAAALKWDALETTLADTQKRYLDKFVPFDDLALLKTVVKVGAAVAHTLTMARELTAQHNGRPFELEMSVDETGTTTSLHEHFFIVSELQRLNVPLVSLAPRFVGRFEKGVDYIGDLQTLEANIADHAAIMRHFGSSYKLSLHTGSDKFGVYPLAMKHTDGRVHLKTAGTSYLEALRLAAVVDAPLFRAIVEFARERYETDRKTYHVSAVLDKLPPVDSLSDDALPDLLNQFDARQILHVTFGSLLDHFGAALHSLLRQHEARYHQYIKQHFDKHLEALAKRQS